MASFTSHQTLPDDSSLPSYSQAMSRKKKIIPVVQSEPESSPSPEHPSRPISSPKPRDSSTGSTLGSLSSRFRQSQAIEQSDLGNKLKNSFSKILDILVTLTHTLLQDSKTRVTKQRRCRAQDSEQPRTQAWDLQVGLEWSSAERQAPPPPHKTSGSLRRSWPSSKARPGRTSSNFWWGCRPTRRRRGKS